MSTSLIIGVLFVLACISICVCVEQSQPVTGGEEDIIQHLFLNDRDLAEANKIARPPGTDSPSAAVEVKLGYNLIAITSFDEITGDISMQVWERASWTDARLSWNENVSAIYVPAKYVWQPDIALYSSGSRDINSDEEKVKILSSGQVYFASIRNFNFRCSLDITEFPYDIQACNFTFGSWAYYRDQVEFLDRGTKTSRMSNSHSDWDVTYYNMTIRTRELSVISRSYQTLTMTLEMKRKPDFYFTIFIAPVVVLFCVLPIIHLFPPRCSQKTTLAGLMLICIMLLHCMLYQQIRGFAEDKTPYLLRHYQSLMAMIVVSIGISSLTSTLANAVHTSRRVPAIIRKVMNSVVAKICFFGSAEVEGEFTQLSQAASGFGAQNDMTPMIEDDGNSPTQLTKTGLCALTDELRYGRERRQLEMEWYQLALLIDRLSVVMFVLYIIIGSAVIESH